MNDMAEHHCGHIKAVQLQHEWWCHQKSDVLRGSGDTVCGLCALISGSQGKGYYTTAAPVFARAPEARHDPRTDVLCRPLDDPLKRQNIKFFSTGGRTAVSELEVALHYLNNDTLICTFITLRPIAVCGCAGFGFGCCLWPCKDPAHCVKEPVSNLPQIYGDASAKLSHMAFQPAGSLC